MKQFLTTGIPKVLEPRPDIVKKIMTFEQMETIMEHNDTAILPVAGDCLEGVGVIDGGWVAVDFTHFPAPPRNKSQGGDGSEDICLCYAVFPGQILPAVMLKAYAGVWGTRQMVGTRYNLSKGKHRMDCCMTASRIFGAVYASWDADGNLLWERDPASFPEQLETTPTITGSDVGDPMPLKVALRAKCGAGEGRQQK